MSWRPWMIFGALLLAVVWNSVLLYQERVPDPQQKLDVQKGSEEKLRKIQYIMPNRRKAFTDMGMDDDMADATAKWMDQYKKHKKALLIAMNKQGAQLGDAFCPSMGLPQPYTAMQWIVEEENNKRRVIRPERLRRFEPQVWYDPGIIESIYNAFELDENPRGDATLMAISAILVAREQDALEGNPPFAKGLFSNVGRSPFVRLQKDHPRIKSTAIEYFSLMFYMTMLANSDDGICI